MAPKSPPLDLQARMAKARLDVEDDDNDLLPVIAPRSTEVDTGPVGERPSENRSATEQGRHLVSVDQVALASEPQAPVHDLPAVSRITQIVDRPAATRKPSLQTFSFQLPEPLDEYLRTIAVTRTDDRGDYVSKTGIVLGAFERGRLPATPEEAEALVARVPARFFDSKVTQMSIRIPPETKSALSSMRVRLLQVRSTVLVRDVYMALILDELGELLPG